MFNIAFVPEMRNENGYELGYMMLGSSRQGFRSGLSYWSMAQYQQHWHDAIARLVSGAEYSALITDLPLPASFNDLINWWPMWREDEIVYVREQLVIQSRLEGVFDPVDPYVHIGPRHTGADVSRQASEWTVPLQDFVEFLQVSPK